MHKIQVGQLYKEGQTSWPEVVEWNWTQSANELRLFFRNPDPQEIQAVKTGKVEFGLVIEQDIILLLFRFLPAQKGQHGIRWSDAPYSYHFLPEDRRGLPPQELGAEKRALLQIVLVNASTGITLVIRAVSLSHEFTKQLYQAIHEQAGKSFDKVTYDRQLRWLYATYPDSRQLLQKAVVRCEGGS